ncbi:MAG TPA: hypothetical protein VF186_08745 [Gaiellaceae bacterium]
MSAVSTRPSPLGRAGAVCLVVAPLLAIVGILVKPTFSDDAGPIVSALTDHHGAFVAGVVLQTIALALLVAGTGWLAVAVSSRSQRLGSWGGVLGVAGLFVIAFTNGMSAAAPAIVSALDPAGAKTAIDAIGSSSGMTTVEPLSLLNVVGVALLAAGLRRTGSGPLWAAIALALGSLVDTIGFAASAEAAAIVGFALLALGAAGVVRGLVGRPAAAASSLEPARA